MDLLIQSIGPRDPSFLREKEETVSHSTKQIEWVEQVCAQLSQDHLSTTIEEDEEDEGGYKDIMEHTEVVMESFCEVEETCTGHELHVISPPNFEELLGKDAFAVSLCQTKAHQHPSFLVDVMVVNRCFPTWFGPWGNETREEKQKSSRVWRLHLTQVHDPTPLYAPHARDLRLQLIDENLNFKEILRWTET
ncbi:unnamed protein product [Linum trigynum]|uniref:Uncharacterized protein n=1 Tax=Linum trigynum TaxID=586398 RepID=A0AAV2G8Z9_9ROSI